MIIDNKNNKLEKLSLKYLLIMGLFSGYIELGFLWSFILFLLFILLLLLSVDFKKALFNSFSLLLNFIIILFFIFFNIICSKSNIFIYQNLYLIFRNIITCFMIVGIFREKNNVYGNFFKDNFKFLNFMWIINIIILYLQVQGTGFLIKDSWLSANSFYIDHCSGLFGNSGTHKLSFFSTFMLVYNLYCNKFIFKSKIISLFNIISVIVMLFLSTKNGNDSIFIMYIIFIFYYLLIEIIRNNKFNKILFRLLISLFFMIVLFIIFSNINVIYNYFNNRVLRILFDVLNPSENALGSNERLSIFLYSLKSGFGWKIGLGLGSTIITEHPYLGFVHFGISSIGTFTTLCGIWFYLMFSFFYLECLKNYFNKKNKVLFNFVNFVIIIIFSIYTVVFSDYIIILWFLFIVNMFNLYDKGEYI